MYSDFGPIDHIYISETVQDIGGKNLY